MSFFTVLNIYSSTVETTIYFLELCYLFDNYTSWLTMCRFDTKELIILLSL